MAQHRNRSRSELRLGLESLEPRLALSGAGLTAQYFHNADFTGLADIRTEAVLHNWGSGSPGAGMDADSFSVRWTGQIEPEFSDTYTFRVLSDEGVHVWVDGQLLIDDWTPHSRRYRDGSIALEAGQKYDIRVDYFELSGTAQIELVWSAGSRPFEAVPMERLYESPAGLWGAYAGTSGGSLSRVDPVIDFDWGQLSPGVGVPPDGFTVNWSGQIRADYSEAYTFSTISDQRVRLWIGGELVIDNWVDHTATEDFGTKTLEAGKWYDLRLEYYEGVGPAQIALRWSSERQTGEGVFETVPQENLRAAKATPVTFKNPLGVGADPFVVQWQDQYYMTMTTNGRSVQISRAASLQDIHPASAASDALVVWTAPPGTNYSEQVWAPELHRIGDKWYIYVAASNGNNATHRMHVLERDAADPFGPFVYKGQITAPTDRWAIDGTAFEWQGKLYFVWSGWPGFTDGQQNLYIAEMRNPWTLAGDRVLISTPQLNWERHGLPINEGPQILIHDGRLHIIYSASGFWTPQYALGRLTYNGTGSLLDPASWSKASQPVFAAAGGVEGVGHASFTLSPDGSEHWIVYHAHRDPRPSQGEIRDIRIQPFTFQADGTPNFGAPLPPALPLPAPSIGPDPERDFIEGDFNADGQVNGQDYATWRATFGRQVFPAISADGNGNGVIDAADYAIWKRAAGSGSAVSLTTTSAATELASQVDLALGLETVESPVATSSMRAAAVLPLPVDLASSGMVPRGGPRRFPLEDQRPRTGAADAVFQKWPNLIEFQRQRVPGAPRDALRPAKDPQDSDKHLENRQRPDTQPVNGELIDAALTEIWLTPG